MKSWSYLPSRQFSVIFGALVVSAGLVYAADAVTHAHTIPAQISVDSQPASPITDWQASLASVQTEQGDVLPDAPDPSIVDAQLQAARSSNLTDTISRTLLVNLVNAKQQGLGDDIPTQDELINTAMSQITDSGAARQYTQADVTTSGSSSADIHAYGNAVMSMLVQNSDQEYGKTLLIIDNVTSTNDSTQLGQLPALQKTYERIASKLLAIPVPKTFAPFHLELVNDYAQIASTYDGIQKLTSDPIGGLTAIQQYNLLTQDAGKMFINIAQQINKNGILFTKDEPGATWAALVQTQ